MQRRALSVLLFLSLAFNVAFIAYNGVRLWQSSHTPTHDEIINTREDTFVALLPPEAREELQEQLKTKKPEIKYHMRTMQQLRKKIRNLLDQEPVDERALADAFAAIRLEHDTMQKIYHDTFVGVLKKLDIKERKHVTKNLKIRHEDDDTDKD